MKLSSPVALSEIAVLIGATYQGDGGFPVSGINEIHMVTDGDLTFVDHPKYYAKALSSKASTIIRKWIAPREKHFSFTTILFSHTPRWCAGSVLLQNLLRLSAPMQLSAKALLFSREFLSVTT
jgi:UDP-3-O-[3-hydroxymyristoyl] glucosamine N-acyltransferase